MSDVQSDMDKDLEMVRRHATMLMEHFDTVQVFATRHTRNGTVNCQWGLGNFFARFGQVRLWADDQVIHDPEGEGDQ